MLALLLWVCYTIVLSVLKMPESRVVNRLHLDIVFHFTSYAVMALLGAILIRWLALLPTIAVAAGTEIVQGFLPYRRASWANFGIDLLGMAVGFLIWQLAAGARRKRENGV